MSKIDENARLPNFVSEEEMIEFALKIRGPVIVNNPMLIGVDPWDENLTVAQQQAVVLESAINPMYFYQMVLQVSAKGQQEMHNGKH